MSVSGKEPGKDILLIHGVTYSSNEFDTDYEDYSLVRKLAQDDYSVWRLDIAGFGQSETVVDGFVPDSDYASDDIAAAVNKIVELPEGSEVQVIDGGSHVIMIEKPYYHEFRDRLIQFLEKE